MYCVADDILCELGLSTEVAFVTQNSDEVNFVKRDDWKEGIDLNVIFVSLTDEKISPLHPKSPPKVCSDSSTSKNPSNWFNKQVSLDDDVDGDILQILDNLLNLSEGSESRYQGIHPANIRLDEDSWRRLEDVCCLCIQKTSSRSLQDEYNRLQGVLMKTNIFVLAIHLQDVFKRFQDIFEDVFKISSEMSSRFLPDIFKTYLQGIFKTSSRPGNVGWEGIY